MPDRSEGQSTPSPERAHHTAAHAAHQRERFDARELAMVLSRFDLGAIEHLAVYPRGSRRSPKMHIKSTRGEFLLKRRAPGHDHPDRVAFAHALQDYLATTGYPVPGLIRTKESGNSMVFLNGRAYEMFNYIHGTRYDRSHEAARQVGATLGRFHRLVKDYLPGCDPHVSSFHAVPGIDAKVALIPPAVAAVEQQADRTILAGTCESLLHAYLEAVREAERAGFAYWPPAVLHGDWHPGNLLYRDGRIVAVLDFDSSRLEPRVVDLANAALQFSIHMGRVDQPDTWPDGLDLDLIRCILRGYHQESGSPLRPEERRALPWLVMEALVIETIVPIAATGTFAQISAPAFLHMVLRKVEWIRSRTDQFEALETEEQT